MFGLMFVLSILFWVLILGGGFYIGLRLVRAIERRGADRKELQELQEQILRLEEGLDSMTRDVDRLSEEQRFTMKLLSKPTDPAS
jgi:hypothetical protein